MRDVNASKNVLPNNAQISRASVYVRLACVVFAVRLRQFSSLHLQYTHRHCNSNSSTVNSPKNIFYKNQKKIVSFFKKIEKKM
jgi:hypothetical protein